MNRPDLDDPLCAEIGGDLWFPDQGEPAGPAKEICAGCPARTECLAWALDNDERHGVWGGTTPLERQKLRRKQAAAPRPAVVAAPIGSGSAARAPHEQRAKLLADRHRMWRDGWTDAEIAAAHGIQRSGVRTWRAVNRLPPNDAPDEAAS